MPIVIWKIILRDFWGNNLRVYVAELGGKDQIVAALRTKNAAVAMSDHFHASLPKVHGSSAQLR
jgi:hypothetical protein